MNGTSKITMAFLAAFVMGSGAGYLIAVNLLEEKYAARAAEEVESIQRIYETAKKLRENPEKEYVVKDVESTVNVAGADLIRPARVPGPRTTQYDKIKQSYSIQPPDEEQAEPEGTPEDTSENDEAVEHLKEEMLRTQFGLSPMQKHPYLIGDEEYINGEDDHDHISLYYYKPDDILCEENGDIVSDIEMTVGWDAMAALEMQTTVWVRNERLGVEYEIIGVNSTYAESVHGMKEEVAPEPVKVIKRRRKVSEE